jgi:hypothetical protein
MNTYEYAAFQKKFSKKKKTSETEVLPHRFNNRYNCYYNSSSPSNSFEMNIKVGPNTFTDAKWQL